MPLLSTAGSVRSQEEGTHLGALRRSQRGSCCDDRLQGQDGNRRGKNNLPPKVADRRVPARLDKRTMCTPAISMPRTREDIDGSYLGLPQLQHHPVVQHTTQTQRRSSRCCLRGHNQAPFGRLKPRISGENLCIASASLIRASTRAFMLMIKVTPELDPMSL